MPAVHAGSTPKGGSIQFHIRSNDYFGTLATEIDLLRQDALRRGYTRKHDAALRRIRDDLVYLQCGFRITKQLRHVTPRQAQKTPQPKAVR